MTSDHSSGRHQWAAGAFCGFTKASRPWVHMVHVQGSARHANGGGAHDMRSMGSVESASSHESTPALSHRTSHSQADAAAAPQRPLSPAMPLFFSGSKLGAQNGGGRRGQRPPFAGPAVPGAALEHATASAPSCHCQPIAVKDLVSILALHVRSVRWGTQTVLDAMCACHARSSPARRSRQQRTGRQARPVAQPLPHRAAQGPAAAGGRCRRERRGHVQQRGGCSSRQEPHRPCRAQRAGAGRRAGRRSTHARPPAARWRILPTPSALLLPALPFVCGDGALQGLFSTASCGHSQAISD